MNAKRTKHEIFHDILLVVREHQEIGPTKLLRVSNLSFQMFEEYVNNAVKKGFLIEKKISEKKKVYKVTDKGCLFLDKYSKFMEFLGEFGI